MPRVLTSSLYVSTMLAVCALAGSVSAQSFKVLKPSMSSREAKQLSLKVATALGSDSAFAAGKADVDKYFKGYYFPTMTGTRPEQLAQLGKLRESLFKRYLRGANSADGQKYLTQLTAKLAGVIALGGEYHPAVRYNAVLILGSLDEKYSEGSGRELSPPVPLASSTKALLLLLEKDRIKESYIPPSLKVGALIGLSRHARFGIQSDLAPKVTAAAEKVIAQDKPKDMRKSVHSWMKKLAAEVLVRQQAKALTPDVQGALDSLIAKGVSLDDRCDVASLMKLVDYQSAAGVSGEETVKALGRLTLEVLDDETEPANDFIDELLQANRGIGVGGRGGGGSFGTGRDGDTGPKFERRRVLARVMQVRDALNSLAPVLQGEAASRKDALLEPIERLIDVSTEKDSEDQDVAQEIAPTLRTVKQLVSQWMPIEEPAEEVDPLAEEAEGLSLAN